MNLTELSKPLEITDVEFRLQSITKLGQATLLAYKDARIDMKRLDAVVGAENWKRTHSRENKNCTVSIWHEERKEWISKEDTGTESMSDKEKGLASDSFKRACFNWGIGRELYDYPVIQIKLAANEFKTQKVGNKEIGRATWDLKLREWQWESCFHGARLIYLRAVDHTGKERFRFGKKRATPNNAQDFQKIVRWAIDKDLTYKDVLIHYNMTEAQINDLRLSLSQTFIKRLQTSK